MISIEFYRNYFEIEVSIFIDWIFRVWVNFVTECFFSIILWRNWKWRIFKFSWLTGVLDNCFPTSCWKALFKQFILERIFRKMNFTSTHGNFYFILILLSVLKNIKFSKNFVKINTWWKVYENRFVTSVKKLIFFKCCKKLSRPIERFN